MVSFRSYLYNGISNKEDSFLNEIKNEKLQDLLYYMKNSHIDDLSDVQWAFQPNIYDIANYGTSFDNLIIGCSFLKERCDKRFICSLLPL